MPTPIRVQLDDLDLAGELFDGPTARAVLEALPIETTIRTFGDCYYVETPVDVELEPGASDTVAVGDIAYWPAALAVSFFFGPTPESMPGSDEPVAPSDVTRIGRLAEPARLAERRDATVLRIERA